jgi:membrane-bound ClpP family serine protease
MNTPEITPSGRIVEEQLDCHLSAVQKAFGGCDALAFVGPLFFGLDESVRDAVEWVHRKTKRSKPGIIPKRPKLVVILDTPGGYSQVAERIADCMHKHFDAVEFIVPNRAMSAGTILAMAGDEIWMDYFSVLGPIDPQVEGPKGALIPAHGYLVQYDRLIAKSKRGKITTAELQFLMQKFDPAELYHYEQEMNLSVTLLKKWLVQYKFRNWVKTETRKRKVTDAMKRKCAEKIAHNLNNTTKWHSHGRGISMEVLRRDVNLAIEDFGADEAKSNSVRDYFKLLTDYMAKLNSRVAVHVMENFSILRTSR